MLSIVSINAPNLTPDLLPPCLILSLDVSVPTTTVYLLVYLLDLKVTYIKLSKNAFHMHCLSTHYSILYYNNLFFFLALRLIFQLLTVTIFTEFQFLCSLLRAVETYKTLG